MANRPTLQRIWVGRRTHLYIPKLDTSPEPDESSTKEIASAHQSPGVDQAESSEPKQEAKDEIVHDENPKGQSLKDNSPSGKEQSSSSSSEESDEDDAIGDWNGASFSGEDCWEEYPNNHQTTNGAVVPSPSTSKPRRHSPRQHGLPKYLQELFTVWICKLCNCSFTSPFISKDHYFGKKHKSNIKRWLFLHPQYYVEDFGIHTEATENVYNLYCQDCDIAVLSEQQAENHSFESGHRITTVDPVESEPSSSRRRPNRPRNRKRKQKNSAQDVAGAAAALPEGEEDPRENGAVQKLYCNICRIYCISEITLTQHLNGAKHKKKLVSLRSSGLLVPDSGRNWDVEDAAGADGRIPDLCDYRTPSGRYYCRLCDVIVDYERNFMQHLESRMHKQRMALPRR